MNRISYLFIFSLLLTYCLFEVSCTASKKGCDDPNAVNYAFDADEPCTASLNEGDCPCTYPRLLFNTVAGFLTTQNGKDSIVAWKANLPILNSKNQFYYLKGFSFFISNIELIRADGKAYSILDSVTIPIKRTNSDSFSTTILNNLNLIDQQNKLLPIGTFREIGVFNKLQFTIGLETPENNANIYNIKMPGSHPLNTDSLYNLSEYKLQNGKIWYQSDTLKTQKPQYIFLKNNKNVSVVIPSSLQFKQATDITLNLYFDFKKIFDNVDFSTDSQSIIENKVLENIANAFYIRP